MAHPRLRATVPFLLLAALGLALAWPALGWPMTYDDLHLVRSFSAAEIARAFAGNWDPDDMENAGLRPLFVLFDHLRYAAFGEHVAAQRVFLVSLFAGYLALLARPLARLGIGAAEALAAGILCLFSRFSVYHYAFLTDGAHLVQGGCFALALGALLRHVDGSGRAALGAAVLWTVAGLLVREDSLAVVPVLALLALVAARGRIGLGKAALAAAALVLAAAAVMGYRALVVAHPPRLRLDGAGFALAAAHAASLSGRASFDGWSRAFATSVRLVPLLPFAAAALGRGEARWRPLLWVLAAMVACSPALVIGRENLLLFPITFMAVAVAASLGIVARRGPVGAVGAGVLLVWLAAGEFHLSREFQLVFHPWSATSLRWSGEFVYGPYWQATVPAGRREEIVARLAAIGIRDEGQFREKLPRKTYAATIEGPWRPTGEARLFAPRLGFRAFRP